MKTKTINASNSIAWEPRLFVKPGRKYSQMANATTPSSAPRSSADSENKAQVSRATTNVAIPAGPAPSTSASGSSDTKRIYHRRVKLLPPRPTGNRRKPQQGDHRAWQPNAASKKKIQLTSKVSLACCARHPVAVPLMVGRWSRSCGSGRPLHLIWFSQ